MTFRIALTADFQKDGKFVFPDFDLEQLKTNNNIEFDFFNEHKPEIDPEQLKKYQGVIVMSPKVTKNSLSQSHNFLIICQM